MAASLCFLRNSIPWVLAFVVTFFVCASFLGYGFLSIFLVTSLVLILSTVLFTFSKSKKVQDISNIQPQIETTGHHIHDSMTIRPPDLISESESIDHSSTNEDSDVDWPYSSNMDYSDDCISDEESLIEIAIPSGHYVTPKQQGHPKFNFQHKLPDFAAESVFGQHGLMELLADINEINEEENLIEIDISVGSIKGSRFEIGA